jgi:hypothetical protein
MDDDESNQDVETNIFGESFNKVPYVGNVLQSIWIRCSSILSDCYDREFILCKFNFVLRIGTIFWSLFLISEIL